jgi:hypothetical protein
MLHTLRAATVNGGGSEVVIWVQTSGKVSKKAKGGEKKATHNGGLLRAAEGVYIANSVHSGL